MRKKIVSTCSPNHNMYWVLYSVYRQEIPWRVIFSYSVRWKGWNRRMQKVKFYLRGAVLNIESVW